MNFILSLEQRNFILSCIEKFPLKDVYQSATILMSIPELKQEQKVELKNENITV